MSRYGKVALMTFGLAILLFIAWQQRAAMSDAAAQIRSSWAFISLCILVAANIFAAYLFATILRDRVTSAPSSAELAGSFLVAQAGKYLPGKIWPIVLQAFYLNQRVGTTQVAIVNLEVALLCLGVTAALGASLLLTALASPLWAVLLMGLALTFAQIMLRSNALEHLGTSILSRLGQFRNAPPCSRSPDPKRSWRSFMLLAAFLLAHLTGWMLFTGPSLDHDLGSGLRWTALISLSYVIGIASLFPAGLGVRELSMMGIAPSLGLDVDEAAGIALLSRLLLVALDLSGAAAGSIFLLANKRERG